MCIFLDFLGVGDEQTNRQQPGLLAVYVFTCVSVKTFAISVEHTQPARAICSIFRVSCVHLAETIPRIICILRITQQNEKENMNQKLSVFVDTHVSLSVSIV